MSERMPSPVMRRRQLGGRLREMREGARKSLEDVAQYLECSAAKVSRIETGRVAARVPDVRSMLELYGAPAAIRDELLTLVRDSRERPWWSAYADHIPESLSTLIGLTEDAARIDAYAAYLVPGLLQTRAYAQAVAQRRQGFSGEEYERFIDLRMARQAVLTRKDPPRARFLLEEAVLRRPMDDPAVRRDQLLHLAAVAGRSNVTVRVVPLAAGLTAGVGLSFSLLHFDGPEHGPVAHVDLLPGGHFIRRPAEVRHFLDVFESLLGSALRPAESVALVRALGAHWEDPYHDLAAPASEPCPPVRRRPPAPATPATAGRTVPPSPRRRSSSTPRG
jgi:transcriptional regulator with XRE-family HTH domain